MLDTILTLIVGAVIAIASGWITSVREHNFRMAEEKSRREFELARNEQEKRYAIVLAKSERAEKILDELEDGFYALMPAQEHICRGGTMTDEESKRLLVPYDNTSKNFSKLLVFGDDLIKNAMNELVLIYVQEFTFTNKLNATEPTKRPEAFQNMIRGYQSHQRVTQLLGIIRKRIDDLKMHIWTSESFALQETNQNQKE